MKRVHAELGNEWTSTVDAIVKLRNAHLGALASLKNTHGGQHVMFCAIDNALSLEPLMNAEIACDQAKNDLEGLCGTERVEALLAFLFAAGTFRAEVVVFENKVRTNTALVEHVVAENACGDHEPVKNAVLEYCGAIHVYNGRRVDSTVFALPVTGTSGSLKPEYTQTETAHERPVDFERECRERQLALVLGSARKRLFH